MKTVDTGRCKCARKGSMTPKIISLPNVPDADLQLRAALALREMVISAVYSSLQPAMASLRNQEARS